jgi:hypothetical protein
VSSTSSSATSTCKRVCKETSFRGRPRAQAPLIACKSEHPTHTIAAANLNSGHLAGAGLQRYAARIWQALSSYRLWAAGGAAARHESLVKERQGSHHEAAPSHMPSAIAYGACRESHRRRADGSAKLLASQALSLSLSPPAGLVPCVSWPAGQCERNDVRTNNADSAMDAKTETHSAAAAVAKRGPARSARSAASIAP